MHKQIFLFLMMFLSISLASAIPDQAGSPIFHEINYSDIVINETANASEIWITSEGNKDDVSDILTSELTDDGTYRTILNGSFTFDIDMDDNAIQVQRLWSDNFGTTFLNETGTIQYIRSITGITNAVQLGYDIDGAGVGTEFSYLQVQEDKILLSTGDAFTGNSLVVEDTLGYTTGAFGVGGGTPTDRFEVFPVTAFATIGASDIGSWRFLTSYAQFGNQNLDQSVISNYAIIQSNTGQTFVNSATGKTLSLRIGNVDRIVVDSAYTTLSGTNARLNFENLNNYITRVSATGTMAWVTGGQIRFQVGTTGHITSNPSGLDADFIIESNNEDKLFYVDGGLDVVRMGDYDTNYFQVDKNGNISQVGNGNATINMIYCEMYNYSTLGGGFLAGLQTAGVYINLTNMSVGDCNGVDFTANPEATGGSFFTIQVAGKYQINMGMDFEGSTSGGLYGFSVAKNHDETLSRECYRRRQGTGIRGALSVTCILDLSVGDTVNVKAEDEGNPVKPINIETINLNIVRVGN